VPALMMAGLPPELAIAANKGQSIWGSAAALVAYWRAGRVDRKQALIGFPLGLIGSAIGVRLLLAVDTKTLRPIVIAMLIAAAVLLLVKQPTRETRDPHRTRHLVFAGVLALAIGCYDGFFGPGTGTFLIVGFVALCNKQPTEATADAKVVNFASNIAAVVALGYAGAIDWRVALPMGAGQLAGGVIGARLAIKGGARLIRIAVVAVSAALIVRLAWDLLP
jgi:uncharacterized membrane protein YfcA